LHEPCQTASAPAIVRKWLIISTLVLWIGATFCRNTAAMGLSGRSFICPKRPARRRAEVVFVFLTTGVGPSVFRGWADQFAQMLRSASFNFGSRRQAARVAPFESIAKSGCLQLLADMRPLLDRPFAFTDTVSAPTVAFEWCAELAAGSASFQPEHIFAGASPGSAVALESLAHAAPCRRTGS